jgi:hypothetical protein
MDVTQEKEEVRLRLRISFDRAAGNDIALNK